jgi:hypothetical protein
VKRRMFGTKKDKITGVWRELHNEELRNVYSSPHIVRIIKSRRMEWAGHIARVGESFIQSFSNGPEGKRQLERVRREWKDSIKMDLEDIGWKGL